MIPIRNHTDHFVLFSHSLSLSLSLPLIYFCDFQRRKGEGEKCSLAVSCMPSMGEGRNPISNPSAHRMTVSIPTNQLSLASWICTTFSLTYYLNTTTLIYIGGGDHALLQCHSGFKRFISFSFEIMVNILCVCVQILIYTRGSLRYMDPIYRYGNNHG